MLRYNLYFSCLSVSTNYTLKPIRTFSMIKVIDPGLGSDVVLKKSNFDTRKGQE